MQTRPQRGRETRDQCPLSAFAEGPGTGNTGAGFRVTDRKGVVTLPPSDPRGGSVRLHVGHICKIFISDPDNRANRCGLGESEPSLGHTHQTLHLYLALLSLWDPILKDTLSSGQTDGAVECVCFSRRF